MLGGFSYINFYSTVSFGICSAFSVIVLIRIMVTDRPWRDISPFVYFVPATFALGLAALTPVLGQFLYPFPGRSWVVAIGLAFCLSLYFLGLTRKSGRFGRDLLLVAVMLLLSWALLQLPLPAAREKMASAVLVFLVYLYLLVGLAKEARYQEISFRMMVLAFALFIIAGGYDVVSRQVGNLPSYHFSLWIMPVMAISMGYYTLDQACLHVKREMQATLNELAAAYQEENGNVEDVIISLARTVDAKDKYTEGHIERVSQYAVFLGERIGMDSEQLDVLRIGSLIHDIGKICVDLEVLNKPGPLNEEELAQMRLHTVVGEQICSPLKALEKTSQIIRSHHEKLDGSGYPDGLKGGDIPLEVRIVTIADIFDALTTDRPYRPAMEVGQAFAILRSDASSGKLDSNLVEEFISMTRDELGLG